MSQLTKLLSDRISFIDNSSNTGELAFESDLFNINKSVNFSSNISASNITVASGGLEIVDYNTTAPTTANSGKLYKATSDERIHWLTNTNDSVLAYKTEVDTKAGKTVSTNNPTASDDVNAGYSIGDIWVNEEGTQSFICVNNSVGAAEWELFGSNQSLNTNDNVSFNSVNTPAISSGTDVIVSSPLIVDSTIKLKSTILDTNGDEAYILKKQSGNNSYAMGNLTYTGTGADNLSIGYNVGSSLQTGIYNVFIGNTSAKSSNNHRYGVVIGNGCANTATGDSIVAIGNTAGSKIGAYSICMGRIAGFNATGTNNIIIGNTSGANLTSGVDNVFIGYNSGCTTASATSSNMIGIGAGAQTTAANQCVVGSTSLAQFQSDGFRDLDTKSANVLGIGKTNATKVEIAKTGVITEIKGDLNVVDSGALIYNTSVAGIKTRESCLHVICTEGEGPIIAEERAGGGAKYQIHLRPHVAEIYGAITMAGRASTTKCDMIQWDTGDGGLFSNLGRMRFNLLNADVQENQIEITTSHTNIKKELKVSSTTASTSTTTGSITTAGGLGVVGDVKVGAGIELFADNAVKPTTSTWTIASDIQFKEDIQDADLQRCADDISTLQLMRFKWKDDYITKYNVKDHHTLGFIAQDVQTKFPKSVDTVVEKDEVNNTESSRLGLDYHAINMSLIGAVQYLIKENQLLKSRLDILDRIILTK